MGKAEIIVCDNPDCRKETKDFYAEHGWIHISPAAGMSFDITISAGRREDRCSRTTGYYSGKELYFCSDACIFNYLLQMKRRASRAENKYECDHPPKSARHCIEDQGTVHYVGVFDPGRTAKPSIVEVKQTKPKAKIHAMEEMFCLNHQLCEASPRMRPSSMTSTPPSGVASRWHTLTTRWVCPVCDIGVETIETYEANEA